MGTVRYTVVDGEVIAEKRGGVRKTYVPDPLGSTVALLDNTQAQTDTFTYWPYGEVKTRTGTTATPFQFVGTLGYYHDSSSRDYVRARHLRKDLSRWQTEDLVREDNLYAYVAGRCTSLRDPSGLTSACDCQLPSNPLSHDGQVYVDCNCVAKLTIAILPEHGNAYSPAQCGRWLPADAISIGGVWFKIHGQSCLYINCSGPSGVCCRRIFRNRCEPTFVPNPGKEFGPGRFPPNLTCAPVVKGPTR